MRPLALLLVLPLAGCKLLDSPVFKPGAPDADGNPTEPVLVVDQDGTERTVGEELADAIDSYGPGAAGTISTLGGPLAPILGLAGMLGLGGAATALRKRHPGKSVASAD